MREQRCQRVNTVYDRRHWIVVTALLSLVTIHGLKVVRVVSLDGTVCCWMLPPDLNWQKKRQLSSQSHAFVLTGSETETSQEEFQKSVGSLGRRIEKKKVLPCFYKVEDKRCGSSDGWRVQSLCKGCVTSPDFKAGCGSEDCSPKRSFRSAVLRLRRVIHRCWAERTREKKLDFPVFKEGGVLFCNPWRGGSALLCPWQPRR